MEIITELMKLLYKILILNSKKLNFSKDHTSKEKLSNKIIKAILLTCLML